MPTPNTALIRALPKTQLHCHLEGTLAATTFRELARTHDVASERARGPHEATYAFATFREFLLLFAEVCKTLQTPDDFALLARDYVAEARAGRVRYAELFISPSVWTFFHEAIDPVAVVRAMREVFDDAARADGLDVALICDLTRNFGVERALATARLAERLMPYGVIGVGLGGDEANHPPELFADAFASARAAGLHGVAHAGEAAGAASIRGAIDALGAERIGHGVRSLEDDALVEELAARGIALEICPTSNRLTGAVPAGEPHPIGELDRRGVRCVIDADDPALFSTTLAREYAIVAAELGEASLVRFARQAIDASFANAETKARLHAELATAVEPFVATGAF